MDQQQLGSAASKLRADAVTTWGHL